MGVVNSLLYTHNKDIGFYLFQLPAVKVAKLVARGSIGTILQLNIQPNQWKF